MDFSEFIIGNFNNMVDNFEDIKDDNMLINEELNKLLNPVNENDKYIELNETDEASKNNGMLTKVWGPPLWIGLHAITFGYPAKIDENNEEHIEKRKRYYNFFKLVGDILPCKYCRQSYKVFFEELDLNKFLNRRKDIVRWLYLIHEKVNDKLKVPECDRPTFKDFTQQYETYRAKCKPDNREEELVKQANEEKGCIKPLDNTPKRAVINVVKCQKGDVTRRDNMLEGWVSKNEKNNYILIKKTNIIYTIALFLVVCFILYSL